MNSKGKPWLSSAAQKHLQNVSLERMDGKSKIK